MSSAMEQRSCIFSRGWGLSSRPIPPHLGEDAGMPRVSDQSAVVAVFENVPVRGGKEPALNISGMFWLCVPDNSLGEQEREVEEVHEAVPIIGVRSAVGKSQFFR